MNRKTKKEKTHIQVYRQSGRQEKTRHKEQVKKKKVTHGEMYTQTGWRGNRATQTENRHT